ncbi:hypothetical protein SCP_0110610 [Sparassis crispa]|uniref:Uncharacterized protein n=1 Tax=Sparassis crispa TaxID=139825 RepID=A0A401G7Q4_9APHY|nr:hypothetical protein SCP_0110610 [Sparassis crispa]GBE78178.1 hypothetical protein SCP_0110610 [Sparassis crispa]
MRSPVVTFSLFAAAAFTVTGASTPVGNANSLSANSGASDARGSRVYRDVQDSGRDLGLGVSDHGLSNPDLEVGEDHLGRRGVSRGYERPDDQHPRPERPARPPAPQLGNNYSGTCDGSSASGDSANNVDGSNAGYSIVTTGSLSGGVSCTENAVGASADSSDPNSGAAPAFGAPEAAIALKEPNVADVFDNANTSADTASPAGRVAESAGAPPTFGSYYATKPAKRTFGLPGIQARPKPALRRRNGITGSLSGLDQRVPGQRPAPSADDASPQTGDNENEDITSFADAVGAAGSAPPGDNAVFQDADSNQDGAPGQSIQGAGIPGIGDGQNPGGEANPGAPGSANGGTVSNSGNVNNDVESNTPGVGGLSRTGVAAV